MIRSRFKLGFLIIFLLFSFLLVSGFILLKTVQAQTKDEICPNPAKGREGPQTVSKLGETPGAFPEEDTCAIGLLCFFQNLFFWGDRTGGEGGTSNFLNSSMPYYLRFANELLLFVNPGDLSFVEKQNLPAGITGSLPKLFPTGGGFNEQNHLRTLYRAEGVLVSGSVLLNQQEAQFGFGKPVGDEGYGDTQGGNYVAGEGEDYVVPARFGEVSPLTDRFGLLKQALFPPSNERVNLATPGSSTGEGCPAYDRQGEFLYYPTPIDVQYLEDADPAWGTQWTTYWEIREATEGELGSGDASATGSVAGNLDTESKVSYARTAWERIGAPSQEGVPNSGGVYNLLLHPDQDFDTYDAETTIGYDYDAFDGPGRGGDAQMFIDELGNVEGAINCIINGVTAQPSLADPTACDNAFAGIPPEGGIGGIGGTGIGPCEEFGWPLESGFVYQGSDTGVIGGTHPNGLQALDIASPTGGDGAEICSTFNGEVIGRGYDWGVYGNWVEIQAEGPRGSLRVKYGHMQVSYVRVGQRIEVGRIIGKVGHTGMGKYPNRPGCQRDCTSPHLHYEFHGASMQPPQIPNPIPFRCRGREACNVSW